MTTNNTQDIRETVREGYSEIARSGQWSGVRPASQLAETGTVSLTMGQSTGEEAPACCSPGEGGQAGGCCGPTTLTPEQVALAVGYTDNDLTIIPDGANMGLSCGNPTALASLAEGEVVVDLGSGGGFDCFIAGPKVGKAGHVIGVDMTPDMLGKARKNIASYSAQSHLSNVEFRLGEIENLPIADNSVDVVISNCVINLSPNKPRVWQEITRVLKSGGRVAVSDLALLQPLPGTVKEDLEALVGCIAGADLVEDVRKAVTDAGLTNLKMEAKPQYIEAMTDWQDPLYLKMQSQLPQGGKISDYVVSLDISATKG